MGLNDMKGLNGYITKVYYVQTEVYCNITEGCKHGHICSLQLYNVKYSKSSGCGWQLVFRNIIIFSC